MQLALRPYAAAGVALAAASVIAVTPAITPPTQVQTRAVQMTALDNPIEVFTPVFDQASALVQLMIANETATPAPLLNAIIARAGADGKTLGEIATGLGNAASQVATNLPPALQAAAERYAAGDLVGGYDAVVPAFIGPFLGLFSQVVKLQNMLSADAGVMQALVRPLVYQVAWSFVTVPALAFANIARTSLVAIQGVGTAIASGSPEAAANAVQHGLANLSSAVVASASSAYTSIQSARTLLAKPFRAGLPTAAAAVEPDTTLALAAAPETSKLEVDETASAPKEEPTAPAVETRAKPKLVKADTRTDARKAVTNNVRDSAKNLNAGIKKATDGLKKAAQGLTGKKAKTASSDSDSAAK
ncbi:hypothetical protein H5U98_07955 [Mycolicibacterium boenickei]|uniref:PE-PGRS family protein n=1 Tax=Mycolicibacterium boenickei TaxID=146017 RepID=A0AAX3A1H7_9MYCO|nr:hypothetical protein [Mycolicibacterium boenickei]UNC01307.1 hypothetical protein H5U98_07955 [Mycolicibacterium boenickei]BBX91174.1 hypothetical protein MBOE_28230 [Mycolicibacterium boenickei]